MLRACSHSGVQREDRYHGRQRANQAATNDIRVALHERHPDFPQCGFSAKTVSVLRAVGAKFAYINIFEDPEIRDGLKVYSNWPTFPQLYVNGELIGGCDIAVELYQSGELQKILGEAPAPAAAQ
jgi:monothiol glutaredoxin